MTDRDPDTGGSEAGAGHARTGEAHADVAPTGEAPNAVGRNPDGPGNRSDRSVNLPQPLASWDPAGSGVLWLPSGRLVRGRALRRPLPDGPVPSYALYLLGSPPPEVPWEADWLRWPDFRLPGSRSQAHRLLTGAWDRAAAERVEVACGGGRGRTGTALACLAVLDGVPPRDAVAYVRAHYDRHAVETPWQRRYVRRFTA